MNTRIPTDTSRVPTLPMRGPDNPYIPPATTARPCANRGPYRVESGLGYHFVIDAGGQQVGNGYDEEADAKAAADALNYFGPDGETAEVAR